MSQRTFSHFFRSSGAPAVLQVPLSAASRVPTNPLPLHPASHIPSRIQARNHGRPPTSGNSGTTLRPNKQQQLQPGNPKHSPPDRPITTSTSPTPLPGESLTGSPVPPFSIRPRVSGHRPSLAQCSDRPHTSVEKAHPVGKVQSQVEQARGFTIISGNAQAARQARAAASEGNGSAPLGQSQKPRSSQSSLIEQTKRRIAELRRKEQELLSRRRGSVAEEELGNIRAEIANKEASLALAEQKEAKANSAEGGTGSRAPPQQRSRARAA